MSTRVLSYIYKLAKVKSIESVYEYNISEIPNDTSSFNGEEWWHVKRSQSESNLTSRRRIDIYLTSIQWNCCSQSFIKPNQSSISKIKLIKTIQL